MPRTLARCNKEREMTTTRHYDDHLQLFLHWALLEHPKWQWFYLASVLETSHPLEDFLVLNHQFNWIRNRKQLRPIPSSFLTGFVGGCFHGVRSSSTPDTVSSDHLEFVNSKRLQPRHSYFRRHNWFPFEVVVAVGISIQIETIRHNVTNVCSIYITFTKDVQLTTDRQRCIRKVCMQQAGKPMHERPWENEIKNLSYAINAHPVWLSRFVWFLQISYDNWMPPQTGEYVLLVLSNTKNTHIATFLLVHAA